MNKSYDVYFHKEKVGEVLVNRVGLFYQFACKCTLNNPAICSVVASCGDATLNLGVLVPTEGAFILEKQIPVKKIVEGEWAFYIQPKGQNQDNGFIQIEEDKPFAYLEKLPNAYMAYQNGQAGIKIRYDQNCNCNPTGQ